MCEFYLGKGEAEEPLLPWFLKTLQCLDISVVCAKH